ncbi:hypothetical protein MKZ38_003096 [Zalerion maritima]|uniref:LSM2-LSM8 complex subunit LSM8 n=1 Tax=Zalerion maritima TaxID=339359 RepID=A0AAD5WUM8_9PEZI|nr:hypothetical protein MKZ38_003096 [Zalerion maritima]
MSLNAYLNKKVLIITADSRTLVGTLVSCDNSTNLVLSHAEERIIRVPDDPEPSMQVPLGLYLVRGDNVCTVGVVDETMDESINWSEVKGTDIKIDAVFAEAAIASHYQRSGLAAPGVRF